MNTLTKRLITGFLLVGLIIGTLFLMHYNPIYFAILTAIIALFGIYEMNKAQKDILPVSYKVLNLLLGLLLLPSFFISKSLNGVFILIALLFLVAFIIFTFDKNVPLQALQSFVLILFYPSLLLAFIFDLTYRESALFLLILVFGIGPMADTFAFAVGSIVKGKKLCPHISPKKTISGAIGGLIGGIITGFLIYIVFINFFPLIKIPSLYIMLIVGFTGAAFTEAGDLAESALKRRFNLKDFGNLLPGHGGVLDRMDGIMFNSLFIFLFFTYICVMV